MFHLTYANRPPRYVLTHGHPYARRTTHALKITVKSAYLLLMNILWIHGQSPLLQRGRSQCQCHLPNNSSLAGSWRPEPRPQAFRDNRYVHIRIKDCSVYKSVLNQFNGQYSVLSLLRNHQCFSMSESFHSSLSFRVSQLHKILVFRCLGV